MKIAGDETDDLSTMPSLGHEEAPTASSTYTLVVTAGPDRGCRLVIDAKRPLPALIGHSAVCELRLSDLRTSRRHASVSLTRRGLRLTDLSSKNGTMVGSVRIAEALLDGGEDIHLGDTVIRVERGASGDAQALTTARRFGSVIGASPEMRRLFPLCEGLAAQSVPILLEGEPGTGKEKLSEALHEASPRAARPFVVFDCTSMTGDRMAEVLCGRADGEGGAVEEAAGGTLFIDEVGDLDPVVQPRLLRLLDRGEVVRVGARDPVRVDVRVIASTGRNLDHEVHAGRFDEELFARLAAHRIELPPLRDRAGDIGVLTRHFWRMLGDKSRPLPPRLVERFSDQPWPGNVSELMAAVVRAHDAGDLAAESRPPSAAPGVGASTNVVDAVLASGLPLARGRARVIADFERRYVQHLLEVHRGNVSRAAVASGIARRYFQVLKARHLKDG